MVKYLFLLLSLLFWLASTLGSFDVIALTELKQVEYHLLALMFFTFFLVIGVTDRVERLEKKNGLAERKATKITGPRPLSGVCPICGGRVFKTNEEIHDPTRDRIHEPY